MRTIVYFFIYFLLSMGCQPSDVSRKPLDWLSEPNNKIFLQNSKIDGVLQLIEHKSLSETQAKELSDFQGLSIYLDGLSSLPVPVARQIAKFQVQNISMANLQKMNLDAAQHIASFSGKGITLRAPTLKPSVAQTLAFFDGEMLTLLTNSLTKEAALQLAKSKSLSLAIHSDSLFLPDVIASFQNYKGKTLILLNSVFSPDITKEMTKLTVPNLQLHSPNRITHHALVPLERYQGEHITLVQTGMLHLEEAESLKRFQVKKITLQGIQKLSEEAAKELAAYPGELSAISLDQESKKWLKMYR